jgi:hypothetical protein
METNPYEKQQIFAFARIEEKLSIHTHHIKQIIIFSSYTHSFIIFSSLLAMILVETWIE